MLKILNLKKKNRVWFAAEVEGRKCKLKIDNLSKKLELGEYMLDVEDISTESQWGKELKFCLTGKTGIAEASDFIHVSTPFNRYFIEQCHQLGGVWDKKAKHWAFNDLVESEVEELEFCFNSTLISIEVSLPSNLEAKHEGIYCLGYSVAFAQNRDSGAKITRDVFVVKGGFSSGGSAENWVTTGGKGTVFRMKVPIEVFKKYSSAETHYEFKRLDKEAESSEEAHYG
ncbi:MULTISPECIES: hypothetical protein [Vibrio]|uniref:hypothetical protein n=1 Tax=Vibrio TaxID=662 RepID=UPI000D388E2A|nr:MULTISPECIES: hypothetical protein [Vibrio]PTO69916.1 hypothetical protein CWN81_16610 [Vibrio splendidus]